MLGEGEGGKTYRVALVNSLIGAVLYSRKGTNCTISRCATWPFNNIFQLQIRYLRKNYHIILQWLIIRVKLIDKCM